MTWFPARQNAISWVKGKELLLAAAALFLLLCAAYSFSIDIRATRGAAISGDEPFYLLTTQSLLADGDFDLTNQYETRSYKSFFDHPDELWRQSVPQPDGDLLSPHNPGLSFLVIPGFGLGGLAGAQIQLLVMGAATMALAFVLADRLTGRRLLSWVATLGAATERDGVHLLHGDISRVPRRAGAGSLAAGGDTGADSGCGRRAVAGSPPHGHVLAGDQVCATGIAGSGVFPAKGGTEWANSFSRGRLCLGRILRLVPPAPVRQPDPLRRERGLRRMEQRRNPRWAHRVGREGTTELWGLFIDRRFGIGRWAPLLLAAVPGLALLVVSRPACRLILGLIAGQMLIATFVAITMMGWWFPGRTLLTVLPLLIVPVVLVLSRVPPMGTCHRSSAGSVDPGNHGGRRPSRKGAGDHHRR